MLLWRSDGGLGSRCPEARRIESLAFKTCKPAIVTRPLPAAGKPGILAALQTPERTVLLFELGRMNPARHSNQIRRRFWGRQPLCGAGVTSEIDVMRMPREASARTDDSRPGPGPLILTSRFLMPCSWAANGVDLREPLKPWPPDEAHDSAPPWRSVIVMIVLLNDACTCATPSATFLRTFLRTRWAAELFGALAMLTFFVSVVGRAQRLTSSAPGHPFSDPCGCEHWCGCAGREPAG